jgi:hypothetical protein
MKASILSVLESAPQAPANCRTCLAFTRATGIRAESSASTTRRS